MSESADAAETNGRDLGGCPVVHLDVSPPLEAGSYWRQADELREIGPALFNTMGPGYWMFTGHEQVRDIYQQPEIFSSESITPWEPEPAYRFVPTQLDPPEHGKYRRLLSRWFSPGAVNAAEPMMRDICRRLVAEIAPRGGCDFVSEFAIRYPTEVFLAVLGVPASDADHFVPWVEDFFRGFGGDPDQQQAMLDGLNGIREYWAAAVAERRGETRPRDGDLASHLLHSTVDDHPLTDTEVLDILQVLVLAGLDTTRGQLGYLFRHLAADPGDRRGLIDEPALIPSTVEESLRLFTIIFGDGRKVTRDTEFHGCPLKQGDMVYGLVSSANRDPRVYDRAGEFVLDRKGNNHFGFAAGPHRCLGAHLARREMKVAVEEWLRAIPDFRVATAEPLRERGGGSMMTLLRLPLAWETAS
ncbi:cytochrome P450 [Actinomadura vinacea]|uniref:Cytochrome P450 n=1 Tax=Actinomadura vinacea TaxID=115336 RepID=A0ABP5VSU0_9ACTN